VNNRTGDLIGYRFRDGGPEITPSAAPSTLEFSITVKEVPYRNFRKAYGKLRWPEP